MRAVSALLSLLSLPALLAEVATAAHGRAGNHRRLAEVVESSNHTLIKRDQFTNARYTYYNVQDGLQVACGGFYVNTGWTVALTTLQWDGGSHCGEKITISWQGKTTTATIVDEVSYELESVTG
ncbi:hypothetical protein EW026_g1040 [Hermanssonia centrifuga]|uniref:Uncharacterized protein n=1 Tax=Hermanssonia centrifuga TaxID=98765 RepID=A0A4S4KST2_9APHY|nr:hypothetical protein EW026_g1040 [Hermanssonia centrifuga]